MPDRAPPLRTERVTAASRRPAVIVATLAVVLTVLALAKPWNIGAISSSIRTGPPGTPMASAAADAATQVSAVTPSPQPTIDPLEMRKQCQNPDFWRLITVEQSGPLVGRSLLPVSLVTASGPADPRIAAQVVHTGSLEALGYCVPTAIHANVAAAEREVLIWQSVGGHGPVLLTAARVDDPALASVGEVYLVPATATAAPRAGQSPATWPEGRYVFETPSNLPGGAPGWFAFTFASTSLAIVAPRP